jgi:hypothetical protein
MSRGQVDGIIIAVAVLTLALVGVIIASPSGMSGLFTAGGGAQPTAIPSLVPIITRTATPTPAPSVPQIPVIDQTYYPAPVVQTTPTPYPYPYYDPYNSYYQYNPYYSYQSFYPNGTPYYPPGYQYQYPYGGYYYYPNGTPYYNYYPYYNYPYYNNPYYYNYSGSYQASINVISGQANVNVFVDGAYRGFIASAGGSFMAFGLSPGYHTIYVSGPNCVKTDQVYVTPQYQTTLSVCGDSVPGGRSFSGDGTYYLYQGDSVTSNNNARFTFSGFSMWEAGQAALPQATFTVVPRTGGSQTSTFVAGSEYYYDGGSIRINGAVQTTSGILFGVTVSSSGNLQPSPVGTRTLSGRVIDQNGTGIPNAGIMIANAYNAQTYMNTRTTGTDGYYTIPYVPDGFYNVTASASGHYKRTWTFVQVTADTYANYDIATSAATPTPTPTGTPTPTPTATPTPTPTPTARPELGFSSFGLGTYLFSDGVGKFIDDGTNRSFYSGCFNGVCRYPAYYFVVSNTGASNSGAFNVSVNNASVTQNAVFHLDPATANPFPSLSPTASRTAVVYAIPITSSSTLLAYNTIDPENAIVESTRANNSLVFYINALAYSAPMGNTSVSPWGYLWVNDIDENYSTGALQIVPVTNNTTYYLAGTFQFQFFENRTNATVRFLNANRTPIAGDQAAFFAPSGTNVGSFSQAISAPANASYAVVSLMSGVRGITIGAFDDVTLAYTNGTQVLTNPGFNPIDYQATTWAGLNLTNATLNKWILVNN